MSYLRVTSWTGNQCSEGCCLYYSSSVPFNGYEYKDGHNSYGNYYIMVMVLLCCLIFNLICGLYYFIKRKRRNNYKKVIQMSECDSDEQNLSEDEKLIKADKQNI